VFEAFGEDTMARIAESNLANILSTLRRYDESVSRRSAILERLPANERYLRAAMSVRLAEDLVRIGNADAAITALKEPGEYFHNGENLLEGAHYRAAHARALIAKGLVSAAKEEAEGLLQSIDRATLPVAHAKALEVISECSRLTGQDEVADRVLAQAVALYLALGERDKATELSRALLPDRPAPAENHSDGVYGAAYL
jgi:hypothetical protein